jgi:hypothetical protein
MADGSSVATVSGGLRRNGWRRCSADFRFVSSILPFIENDTDAGRNGLLAAAIIPEPERDRCAAGLHLDIAIITRHDASLMRCRP